MSTLAITAAHFVAIPVRYAVGRWFNIPTNTLLVYNGAELGLNILALKIGDYFNVDKWEMTIYQAITIGIVSRICCSLPALYVTSKLTNSMPIECVMMTTLASTIFVIALVTLAEWRQDENE